MFNKKKLNEQLESLQNNLARIEKELAVKDEQRDKILQLPTFFRRIEKQVNESIGRDEIELPTGQMDFSEFIEKTKLKLKEVMEKKLSPDEEDKIKEYQELKKGLDEIYKDWGGKKVWSR